MIARYIGVLFVIYKKAPFFASKPTNKCFFEIKLELRDVKITKEQVNQVKQVKQGV